MFDKLILIALEKIIRKACENYNASVERVGNYLIISVHSYLHEEENKSQEKVRKLTKK